MGSRTAPQVVAPAIPKYHEDVQHRLAHEIENEPRVACPRDVLVENCVVWKRVVLDFADLRSKIRAARNTGD